MRRCRTTHRLISARANLRSCVFDTTFSESRVTTSVSPPCDVGPEIFVEEDCRNCSTKHDPGTRRRQIRAPSRHRADRRPVPSGRPRSKEPHRNRARPLGDPDPPLKQTPRPCDREPAQRPHPATKPACRRTVQGCARAGASPAGFYLRCDCDAFFDVWAANLFPRTLTCCGPTSMVRASESVHAVSPSGTPGPFPGSARGRPPSPPAP